MDIRVACIRLRYADWDGGQYMVRSLVCILDPGGEPVSGVRVTADWTLPDGSTKTQRALTNVRGQARFWVGSRQTGEYQICIAQLEKNGYAYDPDQDVVRCDTLVVP